MNHDAVSDDTRAGDDSRRFGSALFAGLVLVVGVVMIVLLVRAVTAETPVDQKLAAQIRALGITPYVVEFEGAELVDVEVEDGAVLMYYDHGYFENEDDEFNDDYDLTFTLALSKAPPGDLCGRRGSGPRKHGGSCTSNGDLSSSEFEEMGSFTQRKGGTSVTMNMIIDMDDDIARKAFAALDRAERVSVEDLARHGDKSGKRF